MVSCWWETSKTLYRDAVLSPFQTDVHHILILLQSASDVVLNQTVHYPYVHMNDPDKQQKCLLYCTYREHCNATSNSLAEPFKVQIQTINSYAGCSDSGGLNNILVPFEKYRNLCAKIFILTIKSRSIFGFVLFVLLRSPKI